MSVRCGPCASTMSSAASATPTEIPLSLRERTRVHSHPAVPSVQVQYALAFAVTDSWRQDGGHPATVRLGWRLLTGKQSVSSIPLLASNRLLEA